MGVSSASVVEKGRVPAWGAMALCGDRLYSGRRTGIARSFTFRNAVQTLHFVQCTSANGAFAYLRFKGERTEKRQAMPTFSNPAFRNLAALSLCESEGHGKTRVWHRDGQRCGVETWRKLDGI